ncbi:hypothetical protein HY641_04630 [Candidatus Woesearchaeota archaeon]|nr:hypothetical protein [Candidatus Woesearchaeota archaeon]
MTEKAMPVFVKIEDCTDIIDILNILKEKIRKAHLLLDRLHDLKIQEDAALAAWKRDLEMVEDRVRLIDKKIFE